MPAVRIAAVQMDVQLGQPEANLARIAAAVAEAVGQGAQLILFPECAVPGYCFHSLDEARPFASTIPGPQVNALHAVCQRHGTSVVVGMLEQDGERLFNAAVLVGPAGLIASYRKIHLPYLGIDRFTEPGDRAFAVHDAAGLRIGLNICYDSAFPEAARCLALAGADLIVLPTNFPPGAECMTEHVIATRAMENNVYYACVNRIGEERGFRFIGQSKICDVNGRVLTVAPAADPAVLYADIDPERARTKRIVRVPDKHIIDRFRDRRPEMYGRLLQR